MDTRVRWSRSALSDLDSAAEFIGRDSPAYAARLVSDVFEAADTLKQFPERGRMVPELNDPTVRELFVGRYRLIFEMAGRDITILSFVHGARNLEELL